MVQIRRLNFLTIDRIGPSASYSWEEQGQYRQTLEKNILELMGRINANYNKNNTLLVMSNKYCSLV